MGTESEKESTADRPANSETDEASSPKEDFAPEAASVEAFAQEMIRKLEAEKKQLLDQLVRKQAEMENVRKRTQREKEEFLQYSLFNTLQSLLPVLDGFELALASDGSGEEYRKGVELIYQQFCGALEKLGVEPIEAKDREFDPHLHEAVATQETDQYPDHQVIEEIQRGYYFKSRVLRPARVMVSQRPPAEENTELNSNGPNA